jgi:hypothetical protein
MRVRVCASLKHPFPIPVAVESKVLVYDRSIVGIVGSNPSEEMDVRPFCLVCVV